MKAGSLTYLVGDATNPTRGKPTIIAHVVYDLGAWGRGFVVALSRRWAKPEQAYRAHADSTLHLGWLQIVEVEPDLYVANMCAQHGFPSRDRPCALDYAALGQCLDDLRVYAVSKGACVVGPRLGAGIAGGNWPTIEGLLKQRLCAEGIDVTIYDLPATAYREAITR